MFKRNKIEDDKDLKTMTDEQLRALPLPELQRIKNKRWAHSLVDLEDRAYQELQRRNPKIDWRCLRCKNDQFYESEMRVSGGFMSSFFGWELKKYHAITCKYCGKAEFYEALMPSSQKAMGMFGS